MDVKIEPFKPAFFEELLYLIDLNIPLYFAPEEKDDFRNYLENEVEDYYILLVDNKLVGCGGINYDDKNTAVITWDMLHPEYQGQGFGTKLLLFKLDKIKEKTNIERVIVRTSQMAHTFYEKQGFKLLETKKDYWAPGFDLYWMEKKI